MFKKILKELLLVGCGCLTLFLVLMGLSVWFTTTYMTTYQFAPADINHLNPYLKEDMKQAGFVFPEKMEWLGGRMAPPAYCGFYCSFKIPKSDVPGLMPGKVLDWSSTKRQVKDRTPEEPWFNSNSVKMYRAASFRDSRKNILNFLYDDSVTSSELTTVYLEYWY